MNNQPPIGDYAIIGDCRSAALVSKAGSIDWLCWPRFDSDAVFAALLDSKRGGSWNISCNMPFASRRYLPGTNVLETRFEEMDNVISITDFMPVDDAPREPCLTPLHALYRIVRCESGQATITTRFSPRPAFGQRRSKIKHLGKLGLRCECRPGVLSLHGRGHFDLSGGDATSTLTLRSGETWPLALSYAEQSPQAMPLVDELPIALERTIAWWQKWSATNEYRGPHRDAVERSLLTLKLLMYPPSGAIIAAPTTSLPERIGGPLNWDYRYCWLRDASFTLEALCDTGYTQEAQAFAEWLLHATRTTQPKLRVMYDLFGNVAPAERAIDLTGYRDSMPVNIGNGARRQSQLDTYGEVITGVAKVLHRCVMPADRENARVLLQLGEYVCQHWAKADAGIWEPRDDLRVRTHSRLLCWLALDTLLELESAGLLRDVPREHFEQVRSEIRNAIESESWDKSHDAYTAEPGRWKADATLLLLGVHRFEPADSPRMRQTGARVEGELSAGQSLLYRYLPDDGKPVEGAFGICGFWRVHHLALGGGSLAEAEAAFCELLETANDLGLFAEQTDPASGALLGNFPQTFTHVGMINAALAIESRRNKERSA